MRKDEHETMHFDNDYYLNEEPSNLKLATYTVLLMVFLFSLLYFILL